MAEMFHKADANKDEVMDLKEFKTGVMDHPVTEKIFRIKKIDTMSTFTKGSFTPTTKQGKLKLKVV